MLKIPLLDVSNVVQDPFSKRFRPSHEPYHTVLFIPNATSNPPSDRLVHINEVLNIAPPTKVEIHNLSLELDATFSITISNTLYRASQIEGETLYVIH